MTRPHPDTLPADDRGVTPIIQYALTTVIVLGVLSGTILVLGQEVNQTEDKVTTTEGNRLAHEVASAVSETHALAASHQPGAAPLAAPPPSHPVAVTLALPPDIAGTAYLITVDTTTNQIIITVTGDTGRTTVGTAPLPPDITATAAGGTHGGRVTLSYSRTKDTVRIQSP